MLTVLSLGFALALEAPANSQEFKGQVKIGVHKVSLEANKVYEIILQSPRDIHLSVNAQGVELIHMNSPDFRSRKTYCMPNRAGDVNFYVSPTGSAAGNDTTIDYVLKVTGKSLAAKPLLEDNNKWTDNDPLYQPQRNSHFKDYKATFKAGQLYVIDLVKKSGTVDPFLYLDGPDGKNVAYDDDSGGFPNARIIYSPSIDGEFRIIATTLVKATGDFTLTVRQAE